MRYTYEQSIQRLILVFMFDTATTSIYTYSHTLSRLAALPIWRRSMHRLEHRGEPALRIDVCRRRDPDRAGHGLAEVRKNVAEQVGADHHVEPEIGRAHV